MYSIVCFKLFLYYISPEIHAFLSLSKHFLKQQFNRQASSKGNTFQCSCCIIAPRMNSVICLPDNRISFSSKISFNVIQLYLITFKEQSYTPLTFRYCPHIKLMMHICLLLFYLNQRKKYLGDILKLQ